MKKSGFLKISYIIMAIVILLSVGGVFANWLFDANVVSSSEKQMYVSIGNFKYEATNAVEKFDEIINNEQTLNSLADAMDGRGSQSWQISYIGNVPGAANVSSNDLEIINNLFGQDFLQMDLDGTGKKDVSFIIKRENLDNSNSTGASFDGNEMTIYITNSTFEGLNRNSVIDVYAATYVILPDSTEWTQIIPSKQGTLVKGVARANDYDPGWFGSTEYNSFDTDSWREGDSINSGNTMKQLFANALN